MINRKLIHLSLLFIVVLCGGSTIMAIEKPKYKIIKKYDKIEIREYSPYLIAETEIDANFEEASNIAFRRLFKYISGENSSQSKIKMTAPVNQEKSEKEGEKITMTSPVSQVEKEDGKFLISFVVPSKFTMNTVPQPLDKRVVIRQVPAKIIAAIKYSGNWSEEKYKIYETLLIEQLQKHNIVIIGNVNFARYNPPFMPSFLRRNEILIEVARSSLNIKES